LQQLTSKKRSAPASSPVSSCLVPKAHPNGPSPSPLHGPLAWAWASALDVFSTPCLAQKAPPSEAAVSSSSGHPKYVAEGCEDHPHSSHRWDSWHSKPSSSPWRRKTKEEKRGSHRNEIHGSNDNPRRFAKAKGQESLEQISTMKAVSTRVQTPFTQWQQTSSKSCIIY